MVALAIGRAQGPPRPYNMMTILRAKHIIPGGGAACRISTYIENGAVAVHKSKVVAVGKYPAIKRNYAADVAEVIDLGESVILPGFVNAHTHLELTGIAHSIKRVDRFSDWLRQLIYKDEAWNENSVCEATNMGIEMSLQSGTTTVGDISNSGWSVEPLLQSHIRKVVFCEATGFNQIKAQQSLNRVTGILNGIKNSPLMKLGISPHAPYSTSPQLYKACAKVALSRRMPLATHISETESELKFLQSGGGEFKELLDELKISFEGWKPPRQSPIEYLSALGILKLRPLLIHCNYLSSKDIELIRDSKSSVAFCPRSHEYFYHKVHPFQKLISAGVNVALGTDSLASNWSLSLLDEMRFLHHKHKIAPKVLIDMATINGAEALGLQKKIGTLQTGKEADIISLAIKPNGGDVKEPDSILAAIMDEAAKVVFTMIAGKVGYRKQGTGNR